MIAVVVTPLQRVVGFHVSEKTYDLLSLEEQVLVDMKIEGFENVSLAQLFGVKPRAIKQMFDVIRTKLATSELLFHLEMKSYYKEQSTPQLDETVLKDSFTVQNIWSGNERTPE